MSDKLDKFTACSCGQKAIDEQYLGSWGPTGYTCVECLRRANQQAVRKWQAIGAENLGQCNQEPPVK